MNFNFPQNSSEVHWTEHVKRKMLFYGLSPQRIKLVIRMPERKGSGVALNTLAVMKRNDKPKRKEEIWVMFRENPRAKKILSAKERSALDSARLTIISAWRYPGTSKVNGVIPVPQDIIEELERFGNTE